MSYENAKVIRLNENIFVKMDATSNLPIVGETRPVPIDDNAEILGEYWAVPIKDDGQFRGYNFPPTSSSASAPTFDSFKCVMLKDKLNNNTYVIAVTLANWLAGTLTAETIPVVIPNKSACPDVSGNYNYYWAVPVIGNTGYKGHSAYDNAADVVSTGSTLANLVTSLNTNAASSGTWSNASGKLKLVNTDGKAVGIVIEAY